MNFIRVSLLATRLNLVKAPVFASTRQFGLFDAIKSKFTGSSETTTTTTTSSNTLEPIVEKPTIREQVTQQGVEKQQQQQNASFIELRDRFIAIEKYNLGDFLRDNEQALAAVSSIKGKISSMMNQGVDKKSLELTVKILQALSPSELEADRLKYLNASTKLRMAGYAQVPVEEVNRMLKTYETNLTMWAWLRNRKDTNLPLPRTSDELALMYRQQPAPRLKGIKVIRSIKGGPPMRK